MTQEQTLAATRERAAAAQYGATAGKVLEPPKLTAEPVKAPSVRFYDTTHMTCAERETFMQKIRQGAAT